MACLRFFILYIFSFVYSFVSHPSYLGFTTLLDYVESVTMTQSDCPNSSAMLLGCLCSVSFVNWEARYLLKFSIEYLYFVFAHHAFLLLGQSILAVKLKIVYALHSCYFHLLCICDFVLKHFSRQLNACSESSSY